MNEKARGILQLVAAVGVVIIVLAFTRDIERFRDWGYAGVFILSVLSAATLFIPAPGWAIVIAMGRLLDPYLVGLIAGIGSAIGEITGYVAGRGAADLIHDNRYAQRYREWIRKNDFVAIGVLAFIPNPLFDIAGLVAGGLGIPLWRYMAATALGRILRFVLLAQLGAFSLNYI